MTVNVSYLRQRILNNKSNLHEISFVFLTFSRTIRTLSIFFLFVCLCQISVIRVMFRTFKILFSFCLTISAHTIDSFSVAQHESVSEIRTVLFECNQKFVYD